MKYNHFLEHNFRIISASTLLIIHNLTFTLGQYETPNHLCGGWFKSVNASIKFKYDDDVTMKEQVCAWTVSGSSPSLQYGRYDIRIQRISGYKCNSTNTNIAISHFNLYDQQVTATETWNCGSPQEWKAIPGTVFIVVFKTLELVKGTGFQVNWAPSGESLVHGGIRTTAYSWGKSSVEPLPYYASGFFTNEVATHVFPKGNDTEGYELEMEFESIRLDKCEDSAVGTRNCTGIESSLLVLSIGNDARLSVLKGYYETQTEFDDEDDKHSSPWGLAILVWVADFWGAGGNFQMIYRSKRIA